MSILEKLGLARKKKANPPVLGEKKKKEEESFSLVKSPYIKGLIFLGFLGLLMASIPRTSFKETTNYNVNEPWRQEDLTAPFTFALNKSKDEIEQEKEQIRKKTPPIFRINHSARISIQSRLDSLYHRMQPVLNTYATWKLNTQNQETTALNDSVRFVQEKSQANIGIDDQSWQTLLHSYVNAIQSGNKETADNRYIGADIKSQLEKTIDELLKDGIINLDKSDLSLDEITVRDLRDRTEQNYNKANVRDLQEAREYAKYKFSRTFFDDAAHVAYQIFNQVIKPNWIFNAEATQNRIEEAMSTISKTKGAVAKGQVIIRKGDIITKDKYNMLQSLAEAKSEKASTYEIWLRYVGDILAIIAVVMVFFMYLYLYRRSIYDNNSMFLMVFLAMGIIIAASAFIYNWDGVSSYLVPVAIAPIILTIIFDSRVGLLSTFTLALLTGFINGNDFEFVLATSTACSLGVFSVRDIKNRSQFFFTTPGIVFLAYGVILTGFSLSNFKGWEDLLYNLLYVGINSLFIFLTYPLILFFEKTFKVTTDFTLLELSDTNLPLLKRLMTRAPGTFHHSLQVANLAEAAASAIGANALKCRVGALYHDIGKMEKPEYFTENQAGQNVHDKLKPRMSSLVIKAHVSDGVKMAKEHGLPDCIIDFIKTHHGTTLIKFFYEKAKEQADKDEVQEEDFRYDGPLPHTKETAILLLADCVEASSRAMKDPTYQKLENLINRMIEDRISEGQLSDSPLTFHHLKVIKDTFLNILVGIYHSRVEYPDDKKEEEKGKKSKGTKEKEAETKHPSGVYQSGGKATDGESEPLPTTYNS